MARIETYEKIQGQAKRRVARNRGKLTIPKAAREGRVGGTARSTGGKARGLLGYSTWHVSQSNMTNMKQGPTGDR